MLMSPTLPSLRAANVLLLLLGNVAAFIAIVAIVAVVSAIVYMTRHFVADASQNIFLLLVLSSAGTLCKL